MHVLSKRHRCRLLASAVMWKVGSWFLMWGRNIGGSFVSTACHHAVIVSWPSVIIISSQHTVQTLPHSTYSTNISLRHTHHPHSTSYLTVRLHRVKLIRILHRPGVTQTFVHSRHWHWMTWEGSEKFPSRAGTEWYSSGKRGICHAFPTGSCVSGHTKGLSS